MTAPARVFAVDVGGTKTAVALADPADATRTTVRFPTPASAQATLELIERHFRSMSEGSSVAAVGVSFGGHVSGDQVRSLHVPGWEDVDLVGTLSRITGAPVGVLNDAEAGALAEHDARQRRANPPRSLFYVTISTGIGGAIVIDGAVHRGARGLAGEIGHLPVGGSAPCSCGGAGHLEAVAAGPAIARLARAGLGDRRYAGSVLHAVRDELDARAVARAADDGDQLARETLGTVGARLGAALVAVALCLDPAVICLGGGVAQSGTALWDPVREAVAAHPLLETQVERSVHEADSALVGAVLHARTLTGTYAEVAS